MEIKLSHRDTFGAGAEPRHHMLARQSVGSHSDDSISSLLQGTTTIMTIMSAASSDSAQHEANTATGTVNVQALSSCNLAVSAAASVSLTSCHSGSEAAGRIEGVCWDGCCGRLGRSRVMTVGGTRRTTRVRREASLTTRLRQASTVASRRQGTVGQDDDINIARSTISVSTTADSVTCKRWTSAGEKYSRSPV